MITSSIFFFNELILRLNSFMSKPVPVRSMSNSCVIFSKLNFFTLLIGASNAKFTPHDIEIQRFIVHYQEYLEVVSQADQRQHVFFHSIFHIGRASLQVPHVIFYFLCEYPDTSVEAEKFFLLKILILFPWRHYFPNY